MAQHDPEALVKLEAEIEALHQRCGVYTRPAVVRTLLDAVGWSSHEDLGSMRLLEPAAGDGAFIVEAASRLLDSMRIRGSSLSFPMLVDRIEAFEIHSREAARARVRLITLFTRHGLTIEEAATLAERWVRHQDFLMANLPENSFTHVVGNPPYLRWSRIPAALRARYEAVLPRRVTRGDLFLPFLDLGISCLREEGRLGFVCSDRWRHMAFAKQFRHERLPEIQIEVNQSIAASEAYEREVDTYPTMLIMRRTALSNVPARTLVRRRLTLAEADFEIRVGPALGVTAAFVLSANENSVEETLLAPWVMASEVRDGEIRHSGNKVIVMHDEWGKLRNLDDFPRAKARVEKYREMLEARSIVQRGAVWYRPIDRVIHSVWDRPKLLIPELAKVPRVAIDRSGAIPSHGVYAIFASEQRVDSLFQLLKDGGLNDRLLEMAPRVKNGYFRCYKHILERIVL